jgi:mRNA degradation ribonuclease J1/J2
MKSIEVIQVRGASESEGISFFYQLGRIGLIVDCGMDPNETTTREEVLTTYMEMDRWYDAILLTHTHYDHARAAVWVADHFGIPIYTSNYGRKQLQVWAEDEKIDFTRIKINIIAEGDMLEFGPAKIKVVSWAHSTPEAFGFSIRTGGKHIVHLGDGKLTGIREESFDDNMAMLSGLAKMPVDLLVMDILMLQKPGKTKPELPAIENIARTILENPGKKIFVFQYASNDDRIHGVLATVFRWIEEKPEYKSFKRDKIRFLFQGTAMRRTAERMAELNNVPDMERQLNPRDAKTTVVFGTTGGDHSYDRRLVEYTKSRDRSHKILTLAKDDVIIFSAGFIPHPNPVVNKERMESARQLFRDFHALGAKVYVNRGLDLFLSIQDYVIPGMFSVGGHEAQKGLVRVIGTLSPQMIFPFHVLEGSYTLLQRLVGNDTTVLQPANLEQIRIGSL